MPESFGARLRERREQRQIDLSAVAADTKIKLSLLEALERDDVSRWPTGLFRRAYVRAYAQAIGLQPESIVREFMERYPDPAEEVTPAAMMAPQADDTNILGGLRRFVGTAFGYGSSEPPPAIPPPPPIRVPMPSPEIESTAPAGHSPVEPDLPSVARVCARLCRLRGTTDLAPALEEVADILGAVGLIVWTWNQQTNELKPTAAHGYSQQVLAQLPALGPDTDNATAAAFRSAELCVVNGSDRSNGALVAPLVRPLGCVGALAIELQNGNERNPSIHASLAILAAQLATTIEAAESAGAVNRLLA